MKRRVQCIMLAGLQSPKPTRPVLALLRSMTTGAQQALRRTMEIYSNTTRFALACNTSSKVSSRCHGGDLLTSALRQHIIQPQSSAG